MTATMTPALTAPSPRPGAVPMPIDQRPEGPLDPSQYVHLVLSVVHHKLRPAPRDRVEAEEMVGESMIAVVRASSRYNRSLGAPSTFLTLCIINACVHYRKKRIVRERHEAAYANQVAAFRAVVHPETATEDSEHHSYEFERVRRGLLTLKPKDRHLVCRLYGIGCDPVDRVTLAGELGISRERVRQLHDRVRNKLREAVLGVPEENPR